MGDWELVFGDFVVRDMARCTNVPTFQSDRVQVTWLLRHTDVIGIGIVFILISYRRCH